MSLTTTLTSLREKLETPPESIVAAVENLPNRMLSVADVAAQAGVDLNTARTQLMTLASLTGADLSVTADGDILYSFPSNVRATLLQRSLGQRLRAGYATAAPVLFYAVRVLFGTTLLTSLAVLATAFIVLSIAGSSSNSDDDRNKSRGRVNFGGGSFSGPGYSLGYGSPFDFFYYRPPNSYYASDSFYPDHQWSADALRAPPMSFVETFFSYVFGDGDPNVKFGSEQLRYLARMIKENDGVVVAEQMAPYMDPPPVAGAAGAGAGTEVVLVDEAWVLPAVLQLGGTPVATADGDIVYCFDELSKGKPVKKEERYAPAQLYEKLVPFSAGTSPFERWRAGILGVLNLVGALWLGRAIVDPLYMVKEPVLISVLTVLYPPLLAYAVVYNVVPAVRTLWLSQKNDGIKARNERRRQWAAFLKEGGPEVKRKLAAAERLKQGEGDGGGVVGEAEALSRFDRKLDQKQQ